jgi:hypothetical protein
MKLSGPKETCTDAAILAEKAELIARRQDAIFSAKMEGTILGAKMEDTDVAAINAAIVDFNARYLAAGGSLAKSVATL